MMQNHVKPEPTPKTMNIHVVKYEPNYWHAWPSRTVPIHSCSLVANLMGMRPYQLTGYETGYDSEVSDFESDHASSLIAERTISVDVV